MIDTPKKINYLNNKDLLAEIHKSKLSYCEFLEDNSEDYDYIVDFPRPIKKGAKVKIANPDSQMYAQAAFDRKLLCTSPVAIEAAKINRAARLSAKSYKAAQLNATPGNKPVKADHVISPDDIPVSDLVIRFHTYEHIPMNSDRKDKPTTESDYRDKVNFVPFIHYKYDIEDGHVVGLRVVALSHYKKGEFCNTHGSITGKLANMFILLADKYAQKHNWRGYTYVDDMKGNALLQFSNVGLQFNEARSENPFAYLTSVLKNAFLRVLIAEKKQQDIRDDLIEHAGDSPSNGRQTERDEEYRLGRDLSPNDSEG